VPGERNKAMTIRAIFVFVWGVVPVAANAVVELYYQGNGVPLQRAVP